MKMLKMSLMCLLVMAMGSVALSENIELRSLDGTVLAVDEGAAKKFSKMLREMLDVSEKPTAPIDLQEVKNGTQLEFLRNLLNYLGAAYMKEGKKDEAKVVDNEKITSFFLEHTRGFEHPDLRFGMVLNLLNYLGITEYGLDPIIADLLSHGDLRFHPTPEDLVMLCGIVSGASAGDKITDANEPLLRLLVKMLSARCDINAAVRENIGLLTPKVERFILDNLIKQNPELRYVNPKPRNFKRCSEFGFTDNSNIILVEHNGDNVEIIELNHGYVKIRDFLVPCTGKIIFSPDYSKFIVVEFRDESRVVVLYDRIGKIKLGEFQFRYHEISPVFSPDNTQIALPLREDRISVVNITNPGSHYNIELTQGYPGRMQSINFSQDGRYLFVSYPYYSDGQPIEVYDIQKQRHMKKKDFFVVRPVFYKNIGIKKGRGTIESFDTMSNVVMGSSDYRGFVEMVKFSPDGERVLIGGSGSGVVSVFDVSTMHRLYNVPNNGGEAILSPDYFVICKRTDDRNSYFFTFYDVKTWTQKRVIYCGTKFESEAFTVNDFKCSQDGELFGYSSSVSRGRVHDPDDRFNVYIVRRGISLLDALDLLYPRNSSSSSSSSSVKE